MERRLSLLAIVIFLQGAATSSIAQAETLEDERKLALIAMTADRICGVVRDSGSASSAAAKGVVNVELRGLATQVGTGVQGAGEIASDQWQGVLRNQLASLLGETAKCKFRVFEILQVKLLPGYTSTLENQSRVVPPPPVVRTLPCQADQVTKWLSEHGIYADLPFDISIYADAVDWTVNGKPSTKTRSEIAKEEAVWRKLYPVQKYTPITSTSSAVMSGGQCVLTQRVEGYKKSATGKVEFDYFDLGFGIRTDANGPRIVERTTVVLH